MSPLAWIVTIVLIIGSIGALPTWPYSHDWGYYPSGGGLIILLLLIFLVTRKGRV